MSFSKSVCASSSCESDLCQSELKLISNASASADNYSETEGALGPWLKVKFCWSRWIYNGTDDWTG